MLEVARLGRAARVLSQLILQRRSESTMLAATLVALLLIVVPSIAILNVENVPARIIEPQGTHRDGGAPHSSRGLLRPPHEPQLNSVSQRLGDSI